MFDIRGWGQVAALPLLEAATGKLFSRGRLELHLFASLIDQRVAEWIKRQPPAQRKRRYDLRASNKSERSGHTVVAAGKISVKRGHDRVFFLGPNVFSFPLAYARTASIGEDHSSDRGERLKLPVALDRGAYLF